MSLAVRVLDRSDRCSELRVPAALLAGARPASFFIFSDAARVGLALNREIPNEGMIQMSDVHVSSDARHAGIGRAAAGAIWRRFPGAWELQVHSDNQAATLFRSRCIEEFAVGTIRGSDELQEEDGL